MLVYNIEKLGGSLGMRLFEPSKGVHLLYKASDLYLPVMKWAYIEEMGDVHLSARTAG